MKLPAVKDSKISLMSRFEWHIYVWNFLRFFERDIFNTAWGSEVETGVEFLGIFLFLF